MILAPSFHMLQIYDRVLSSGSRTTLLYIFLIAVFALIVYGVCEAVRTRLSQRLAAKYTVDVSDKMFAKFAQFPNSSSAASLYLREYSTIRSFLSSRVMVSLFDVPFIPLYLGLLFLVHWSIGVLTLIGVIVMTFISLANGKFGEESRLKSRQAENEAIGFAQSVYSRGEDVRSLGLLPNFITLWGKRTAASLNASDGSADQSATFYALGKAFRQILQISIMAWGAFLVLHGDMSGGMIFLSSMISGKALAPVEQVIGSTEQIGKAIAAYRKIEELTGAEKTLMRRPDLPTPQGLLEAIGLIYVPENAKMDQRIVDRVSLRAAPGELTAIIGPIGSGKSTFMRMMAGALTPTVGEITMDGAPITQWSGSQWGRSIGYVSQEIELFAGTVAENIARFDIGAPEDAVYNAAKRAGVHDFILSLPGGYQTPTGNGQFMFSPGQKQQIAMARAFYGNPKILLLDEPNASLDQETEMRMLNALSAAKQEGLTIIVISQRASIFRIADHVLRMDDGRGKMVDKDDLLPKQTTPKPVSISPQAIPQANTNNVAGAKAEGFKVLADKANPQAPKPISAQSAAAKPDVEPTPSPAPVAVQTPAPQENKPQSAPPRKVVEAPPMATSIREQINKLRHAIEISQLEAREGFDMFEKQKNEANSRVNGGAS